MKRYIGNTGSYEILPEPDAFILPEPLQESGAASEILRNRRVSRVISADSKVFSVGLENRAGSEVFLVAWEAPARAQVSEIYLAVWAAVSQGNGLGNILGGLGGGLGSILGGLGGSSGGGLGGILSGLGGGQTAAEYLEAYSQNSGKT